MATKKQRYVVVATQTRRWSVVAGELASWDAATGVAVLRHARMVVYFSTDAHSIVGVTARGPGSSARVSPPVDAATVRGVELLLDCTAEARAAIEAEPWA